MNKKSKKTRGRPRNKASFKILRFFFYKFPPQKCFNAEQVYAQLQLAGDQWNGSPGLARKEYQNGTPCIRCR